MRQMFVLFTVLHNRNFALLWLAQVISNVGDWVLWIALPFYVYEQTGSALATGTMFVVETLPRVLLGSLAGVLVDRWSRRMTMILADLLRCLVLLPLLLIHSPERIWLVYPIAFAGSAITQFFNPAKNALIPCLVDKRQLMLANSLDSLGSDLISLVGPALGGVLLGLLGLPSVVLVDSASFLISGIMIFLILVPHNLPDGQVKTRHSTGLATWTVVWQDWLSGLEQVKSERLVITLFTVMGVAMLGQGIISVLWIAFVKEILKGNALDYGWVQVAVAAGGVAGGLLIGHAGRILSSGRLIAFSGMAIGLFLLATFNIPSLLVILALQVLVGVSAVGFFVMIRTLLQTSVADKYLGRIFGTLGTTNALLMLGGQGLASALGDRLGIVPMLDISAILYFLGGAVALIIPSTVDLDLHPLLAIADYLEQHPDATPNEVKVEKAHRDFTEGLKKCPHGVLVGTKCAICDPEGFRADRG